MEYKPPSSTVKGYRFFIRKDGRYLTSLFPTTFGTTIPANVYWYSCQQIALDIAKILDAEVDSIEGYIG